MNNLCPICRKGILRIATDEEGGCGWIVCDKCLFSTIELVNRCEGKYWLTRLGEAGRLAAEHEKFELLLREKIIANPPIRKKKNDR